MVDDLRKAAEMALKYFEDAHGLEDAEVAIKEALRQALAMEEQISLEYCDRCGWRAIAPPDGCLICDREKEGEVTRLRQVCRNVYEIWAGSEGVPMPETCTEGYLLHLIEQMRDEAKAGLPEVPCKTHPDAPHGFDRNGSHNADRYVCECEGWEPPEQEPVGYAHVDDLKHEHHDFYVNRERGVNEVPLYTAPQKREWVGLEAEEVGALTVFDGLFYVETPLLADFIRAIEAKLKEKNT